MKALFILVIAIWSTSIFGQTPINKKSGLLIDSNKGLESDTIIKVVYENQESKLNKPAAFFINGKFVNETLIRTLNPTQIERINVVSNSIQIDSIIYYGSIQIETKINYTIKPISLTDLKNKYTNIKSKSVVFMIDGSIINGDYEKYMVDESNLLTIIVDKIENTKENIHLGLIKILTKSEENIKRSKIINIRGSEMSLTK